MPKIAPLDPDKIKANLNTRRIGRKILVYNSAASTNDIAAEYGRNKDNDGLVVFTEEQTAGRGRAGAEWITGRVDSILCSIVLVEAKCGPELLSLASAVAVAEAIGQTSGVQAKIKWPNDIILNDRKVAGILLEAKQTDGRIFYILGIGINCHQKKESFPDELKGRATSIDIESGTTCDRISLAKRLLVSIEHWLKQTVKNSGKVTEQWRKLSIQLGHRVNLVYDGKEFSGNCTGVDPQKGLILQLDTGGVRMFDAVHTTIVKQRRYSN